ncbi:carbohydrate sulfotransferase 11-like [Gigantopelta aegis]|uniref:carbohydrate sulfotransferase 11-like n=1 Tax=Gigantopelta aegis TaxID=1735272 RepID=UPI001B88B992|nr:carbohydrate sulfotransferase 11-like [Gigantopelta aegis]
MGNPRISKQVFRKSSHTHRKFCHILACMLILWCGVYLLSWQPSKDIIQQDITQNTFSKRKAKVEDICLQNVTFNVDNIWIHDKLRLVYCPVAKVGTTYWKRILLFLNNDTFGLKINTPFDIPRSFVHYLLPNRTKVLRFENATFSPNMSKIMFVREPYSRLWSTYIDKFFLPDFWRTYARFAIRWRRRQTSRGFKCRSDVSFEDFLRYVIHYGSKPMKMNEHWRPIVFICDPCKFQPDMIGKQETFVEDSKFILKSIGQEHLASYNDNEHQGHVLNELSMLIDYNFALLNKTFYKRCISQRGMAVRLWKAFQMNGYIPFDMDFADKSANLSVLDAGTFKSLVTSSLTEIKSSLGRWRVGRRSVMTAAYKMVDRAVLDQIADIFKWDFLFFGYNERPSDIFNPPTAYNIAK